MEKIEVQRQAEKDSGDLHKQVKVLEVELEEQVNRYTEMEQEKNTDLEDLRQKNFSLEKQLEKTRRFLDVSERQVLPTCMLTPVECTPLFPVVSQLGWGEENF